MRSRTLVGSLIGAGIIATAAPARAWYFPEHTELTRLALQDYAPAFVTERLTLLIAEARAGADGVPGLESLCVGASTKLRAAIDAGKICVPYGALAALAADHSNTWYELMNELLPKEVTHPKHAMWRPFPGVREKEPLAVTLTEAARATWISFENSAPRELVEVWTGGIDRLAAPKAPPAGSINPRDYVRSLDAALLVLDPGYASRAAGAHTHFHDITMGIQDVLRQSTAGDFDNVLAQFVAHHLKSLQLAVRARGAKGRARRELQNAALMEHAFALHFLEDGLAAGHLATDPAVTVDEHRAQRHDYFNRQGLAVRRSLSAEPCDPFNERLPSPRHSMALAPCWVAHGDGFATTVDRAYVGEAVARAQTSFALALSAELPESLTNEGRSSPQCKAWREQDGLPELNCDLAWTAFLLDPFPEWTTHVKREETPNPAAWAQRIVERHERAIKSLRPLRIGSVNAGIARAQPHSLPQGIFEHVFVSEEPESAASSDPGLALVRPLMVAWPTTQMDVTMLEGGDIFHRGWQTQISVNGAFGWAHPFHTNAATSVWAGVGAGVGYAAHGLFPMRVNRTIFEANLGAAQGYYLAGSEVPFRSLGVMEVRSPVSSLALYGAAALFESRQPLELLGERMSWGLLGARLYWTLSKDPVISGWDAEVMNLYLGTPGSSDAALSGITATELRLRFGFRSPYFVKMPSMFDGILFVAVELSSGFYTTI